MSGPGGSNICEGLVVECDASGVVTQVVLNRLGSDFAIEPGVSLETVVAPGSEEKLRAFFAALESDGIALGWEINLMASGKTTLASLLGTKHAGFLIIMAVVTHSELEKLLGELFALTSELQTTVRRQRGEIARFERKLDDEVKMDELTGLNNELITAQRELAKKNFELEEAQRALCLSEERLRQIVGTANDFIWQLNESGGFTFVSPQVTDLLGYEPEEMLGRTPFDFMPPEEAARVAPEFADMSGKREPFRDLESLNLHKDGGLVVLETNGVPFFNTSGVFCGYRGTNRDITDRKRYEAELQKARSEVEAANRALEAANAGLQELARHDVLTGLANRMAAQERLTDEHVRMKRTGVTYAVLMGDIDLFKRVNDTHGHAVGDEVLRRVAHTLRDSIRESDFVARFGGEEFLVVLPATDIGGAYKVAELMRRTLEDTPVPTAGQITISMGVALADSGQRSQDDVVREADRQLYRAKDAGRNRVMHAGL